MKSILFSLLFAFTSLFVLGQAHPKGKGASVPKDPIMIKMDQLKESYAKGDIASVASILVELQKHFESKATQEIKSPAPTGSALKLPPVIDILRSSSQMSRTIWSLSIEYESKDYPVQTHDDVMKALDALAPYEPKSEYQFSKKYKTQLKEALKWYTIYCNNIAKFLSNTGKRPIPIRFAAINDKAAVLIVDIASTTIFNTLRSTPKNRAAQVISSCILPNIKHLGEAFENTEISYCGINITYGSKDFSDKDSVSNLKPEVLTFIVPITKIRAFTSGTLTESEFVDYADIYLCDRDMISDIKKIKIQID